MSVCVLSGRFVWVFIALFSSPEELVQESAIFWPYMSLGLTSLLTVGTVLYVEARVSVWASVSSRGE